MRIALIAPPWVPVPPPAYGGIEAVVDTLARGLQACGHEVLLWATGDSSCPVPTRSSVPRALGVEHSSGLAELDHVVAGYDAALAWRPDVVHDHTLIGPVYASDLDVPVVTTNHGPFDSDAGDVYRAICDRIPVIAISHHQASTAVRTKIAAVIHHGVEVERFPLGTGDGGYSMFLGRMHPEKGVDAAVRIARAAGVPLKIAARLAGPLEHEYFRTCVEPLLGGDVELLGEVGGDEKLTLLGGASCLLNPVAWNEPFGMVMIESLACGTPVIATPRGAVSEIVDDGVTGYVRASEPELVHALREVDRLDRAACRRAASERFSAERMVAEHVAVYTAAIAARRDPRQVA